MHTKELSYCLALPRGASQFLSKDVNFLVALKGVNRLAEFRGHEIDGEMRAVHTHTHTHREGHGTFVSLPN